MNIAIAPPDSRSTAKTDLPRSAVGARLIVIHPWPLMRRGITAAIADSDPAGHLEVRCFASVAEAFPVLRMLVRPDIVLVGGARFDPNEKIFDALTTKGVGIVAICGDGRNVAADRRIPVVTDRSTPEDLCGLISRLMSRGVVAAKSTASRPETGMERLSQRQLEILQLMACGLLNKQIAWELGLTEGTVKSHVSAIFGKLGCGRRTQAIRTFLIETGASGPRPMSDKTAGRLPRLRPPTSGTSGS
jgi:DNA-binding NarL/FixJ family response regulator